MGKTKQVIYLVLLILIILVMTFHLSHQTGMSEDKDVIMEKDIVYGKGGDVDLTLDLARPKKARGRLPTLIFIHGGVGAGGPDLVRANTIRKLKKLQQEAMLLLRLVTVLLMPEKVAK